MAESLLAGTRVLDLSRVLAGPWAAQLLADLGADVIKIERAQSGDDTRAWGPPWHTPDTAAYFTCANRGKRSVTADFSNAQDLAHLVRLASQADVLIENFKVGQLEKFGLSAPALHALNPGLIYCSITGYGQTGPMQDQPGYDFAIQALSGLMSITGEQDREPQKVGVAVIDVATGLYASNAIMAALLRRHRTGQGATIDCALLDTGVALLANQASNYLVGQVVPRAMGNAHPSIVPYQSFACADGHVVIAVGNDRQFALLATALGQDWPSDPRFATNPARVKHRLELVPLIQSRLQQHPRQHWITLFAQVGVPCTPIQTIDQVVATDQVIERGLVVTSISEDGRPVRGVGQPMLVDGLRPTHRLGPPPLGVRIGPDIGFSAEPLNG
jgi:crotonobetainyl-CoA:carnitine CoA-transferase CaiB-like acyl-CoA transferase